MFIYMSYYCVYAPSSKVLSPAVAFQMMKPRLPSCLVSRGGADFTFQHSCICDTVRKSHPPRFCFTCNLLDRFLMLAGVTQ